MSDQEPQDSYCNDNTAHESAPAASASGRGPTPGPFDKMNPDPGEDFHSTFTPPVKRGIVSQLLVAYNDVQENHDESRGFNAHTFGYTVYHLAKFRLKELSKESGGSLEIVGEIGGLFRLRNGKFKIGVYKVGSSSKTNIWESFPSTENGANPGNHEFQMGFREPEFELAMLDDVSKRDYVIIAHMGNATDGLAAVYLCIPIESIHGKITRWGYAEQIYSADDGLGTMPVAPDRPPPSEEPEMPLLTIPFAEEPEGEVKVASRGND